MNSNFDKYYQPIPPKIYLGTSSNQPICLLNGIDEDSFSLVKNINNTYSISFDINRFIDIDGEQVESNAYQLIDVLMRIYIDSVGWFCIDPPEVNNDGTKETKSITGESAEIEMANHDIKSLKINKGTTDSYEMLVDGNVEIIDDVEFAKEQIKFCNKTKEELSLLHILLKVSDMHGWSIGYIDDIPKIYKTYKDGELIESQVCLSDEIGTFEVDVQDLYSFLTQDVAKFFNCIFVFDFLHFTINAYRPEHFGKNTNINIGFRNIQQSNSITVNKNDIFTRYVVSGGDDLNIIYVNFGSNIIENLDYFCNEKFMPTSLITKYKLWKDDVEIKRIDYIENTRLYNQQQKLISELRIRVPLDGCSMEWFTFTDDELFEAQANYTAQKKGYEQFYVDENGDFDELALQASSDANDYYQIKDVILPSIQIEIDNRKIPEPDSEQIKDYIDSYETDWKLYGLDELQVKLDGYKNTKKVCEDGKYNVPYSSDSGHTEDMHTEMYNKYLDAKNQLDPLFPGSCQEAYNLRKQEIDEATTILYQYDANRKDIAKVYDKTQWKNGDVYFTKQDIRTLSHLYIDNTYSNENFFLTSSDDSVSAVDEQLKLLSSAQEDLEIASQPQYIYNTSLDNFLALYEYKNYIDNFNLGDFIYLGIDDDKVVKLRIISMQYNLLKMDNELQITFSNMLRTRSRYDDFVSLLDTSNGRGKGGSSGSSNDYLNNEGITLTAGLIQKLLANGSFNNKVSQIINNEFAGYVGKLISVKDLNAELIKATDIEGANGFFEYLQSKLISSDKIIADSGIFKKLSSLVGQIDTLLSGTFSAELGHLIKLTADNVSIDEAVIRDLIAAQITVSMLKAGDITLTDKMRILSENGSMIMNGETLQIMGEKADGTQYVAIQLGYSSTGKPSLIINDETGAVMLDAQGLHEAIVPDNFIKNDMIADNTIGKEKVAFDFLEPNEHGGLDAGKVTINGHGIDVEFSTIQTTIKENSQSLENLSKMVDSIELTGEQVFKEINGVISPTSITVSSLCKNNSSIVHWYINGKENTSFVSQDKTSITIPNSYMNDKDVITIKASNADGSLYDIHSLYKLKDGENGESACSIVITYSNGTVFNEDSVPVNTIATCTVFRGIQEITPKSYSWMCSEDNGSTWSVIGTSKQITIPLNKTLHQKQIYCEVDI